MLQFGASLTDDSISVKYDCKMFIIQATCERKIKQKLKIQLVQWSPIFQHRVSCPGACTLRKQVALYK